MVHRCASTCPANHCNSGGICFRINQVMHYDVAKCFRIACRSSAITGVSSVVRMEDVGDCGQCCEYNADIYAVDEEVFFEDDNCTRRCAGQDVWSGCIDGSTTSASTTTSEATTPPSTSTAGNRSARHQG
ncbi:uncharacterized protein LOC122377918 [Amphibalanus amphitrite]|uniref:uncharacterized protein LOC122377918 n=1 Tax=Amphibalanus amphitrite TaxID=1232801 RepID=UPI001C908A44|nr:uncharacterized protein LOC122377918 [Amphibalanus amphitrite]